MAVKKNWLPRVPAVIHVLLMVVLAFAGFIGGAALGFGIITQLGFIFDRYPGARPAGFLLVVAGAFGGVPLMLYLVGRIPIRCRECGGRAYRPNLGGGFYECADCENVFDPFSFDFGKLYSGLGPTSRKIFNATSALWRLPVIAICFGLACIMIVGAAELIIGMFVMAYSMGIGLQVMVRLVPQEDEVNQPTAWPLYFKYALGTIFLVAAFVAPFRGAIFMYVDLTGNRPSIMNEGLFKEYARELVYTNAFIGACGVYYGLMGILREGAWRLRQSRQVFNLATSKARSAAAGLSEFIGVARHRSTVGHPPGDVEVASFEWTMFQRGGLFELHGGVGGFYLEDDTGVILVDSSGADIKPHLPVFSFLTTFLGRRGFDAALTRRVEKGMWPSRKLALKDGDPVYLIGNVEEREDAAADATGPDRLIVRPTTQARTEENVVLRMLGPLALRPRRDIHDVFFLADLPERRAKWAMIRELIRRALWGLAWTALSGWLLTLPFRS